MASKRKAAAMAAAAAPEEPVDPADELMFLCLGGGNEVGRSCHIIQYKGKTIMVRRLVSDRPLACRALRPTDCPNCSLTPASTPPTTAWPPCPSLTTST